MRRRSPRLALLLLTSTLAACAGAAPPLRSLSPEQKAHSLLALQASDRRVATVAHHLAVAGNAICPVKSSLTGVTLHEPGQYAPELREAGRAVLGLAGGISALAVVPGSPADRAGVREGDRVLEIKGVALVAPRVGSKGSYTSVASAYAKLDRAAASGAFPLRIGGAAPPRTVTVIPVAGCASRVQLVPSSRIEARADGINLSVTTGILAYVRDDDELALVIAHEMAHNALGHRAILYVQRVRRGLFGSFVTDASKVQETERAADRLAYYLMARAGFDLAVAPGFWERLYKGPAAGGPSPTTHPGGATRIGDARRTSDEIAAKRRLGQPLAP